MRHQYRRRPFPRSVAQLTGLGGTSGDFTLTATSRETLELQLGNEFVDVSRRKVEQWRDALTRFLEFERFTDEELLDVEAVEEVEEVMAEQVSIEATIVERPRHKRRATA